MQMHGDASFTGQGVVMESLGLSAYSLSVTVECLCWVYRGIIVLSLCTSTGNLPHYTSGGSVHLVVK